MKVIKQNKSYYNRDNNCCTVLAVMNAFDMTFEDAQEYMRLNCGRKKNKGILFDKVFPESPLGKKCEVIEFKGKHVNGCKYVLAEMPNGVYDTVESKPKQNITLGKFCKEYNKGTYIVLVRGHALAVKDGVVYDHSEKPRRQVRFAYKVKGE